MRRRALIAVLALLVIPGIAGAQKPDPDGQKLADQYMAAYNKGDAKGVAALYTADAVRVGPDGQLLKGRAAIEKSYADAFAGSGKGSKLTITVGGSQAVTQDVKMMDGRFNATGGTKPGSGRYVNTIVRQGSTWLLASVVTIPDPPKK
ncbi:MAG TPA: SgcJ/EcaC family oxidoreductase [Vicinamibacterales bacterium]|nr:SgcJ/EcaC family oxidoreductase [Vicinamibacterales bacterium]